MGMQQSFINMFFDDRSAFFEEKGHETLWQINCTCKSQTVGVQNSFASKWIPILRWLRRFNLFRTWCGFLRFLSLLVTLPGCITVTAGITGGEVRLQQGAIFVCFTLWIPHQVESELLSASIFWAVVVNLGYIYYTNSDIPWICHSLGAFQKM